MLSVWYLSRRSVLWCARLISVKLFTNKCSRFSFRCEKCLNLIVWWTQAGAVTSSAGENRSEWDIWQLRGLTRVWSSSAFISLKVGSSDAPTVTGLNFEWVDLSSLTFQRRMEPHSVQDKKKVPIKDRLVYSEVWLACVQKKTTGIQKTKPFRQDRIRREWEVSSRRSHWNDWTECQSVAEAPFSPCDSWILHSTW